MAGQSSKSDLAMDLVSLATENAPGAKTCANVLMFGMQNAAFPFTLDLEKFDGNPHLNFSQWCEKFSDYISVQDGLNDEQKINRLKLFLTGCARDFFDAIPAQQDAEGRALPKTLAYVITQLKDKYPSSSHAALARQKLNSLRQAPGELVHAYAHRLSSTVRSMLVGEGDEIVNKRLLEEFIERLGPDLRLHVKSCKPTSYGQAFGFAVERETLLKSTFLEGEAAFGGNSAAAAIASLTTKFDELLAKCKQQEKEVMEISRGRQQRSKRKCYYCHKEGHVIAECQERKDDLRWDYDQRRRRRERSDSSSSDASRE